MKVFKEIKNGDNVWFLEGYDIIQGQITRCSFTDGNPTSFHVFWEDNVNSDHSLAVGSLNSTDIGNSLIFCDFEVAKRTRTKNIAEDNRCLRILHKEKLKREKIW